MVVALAMGGGAGLGWGPSVAAAAPDAMKTLYTCGMHPEILSDKPGLCPKCEMKLTPMDADRARVILEARGEIVPGGDSASNAGATKKRTVLHWRSSMNAGEIRDEPGKDSMGMDLVPVYADEVSGGSTIRIDPVTEQNMGVRYEVVRVGPVWKTIRTVGVVTYDERTLGSVTTKIDGWVEKVHVDQTGARVHKGDPLFEFYSPELYSAQEELLIAARDARQAKARGMEEAARLAESRLESSRERLRLFDISDEQIQELESTGKARKTLAIVTRVGGVVTRKTIVEGQALMAGAEAYAIADLSTVWVMGKVYESDLPAVRLGQEAAMTLDYLPGREYAGEVTYVYPYLEKGAREISVRMEFPNPDGDLKPGMYATIRIRNEVAKEAVLAPAMAVIDTGERKVAFVSREPGKFEPRRVTTGVRTDSGDFQILSGLAPGERVVVSGQFLLDSESNLREATLKMLNVGAATGSAAAPRDLPAESAPSSAASTDSTESIPSTKSTSSILSTKSAGPALYTCPMEEDAEIVSDKPGERCPKCNMKLVPLDETDHADLSRRHWNERHAHDAPSPARTPDRTPALNR